MPSVVSMNVGYINTPFYPYIGKRFPSRINGLYSMNKLGQLSVQPNWIGLRAHVKANVVNALKQFRF
jgi:hypothetical protein